VTTTPAAGDDAGDASSLPRGGGESIVLEVGLTAEVQKV